MTEETTETPAGQPAAPAADTVDTINANATPAPTEPTPEPPAEPSPAEIAQQMKDAYTLKGEETPVEPEAGAGEGDQQSEVPFQLEFSEGTQIDESIVGIATKHFKALGADGKAAGACMESIISEMQEAHYVNMAKDDANLKVEWGSEYAGRKAEVENYLRAFCGKNGHPLERVAPFCSPDGYRLMWDMMSRAGLVTTNAAGLGRHSVANDVAWFKKASTPGTPESKELIDTSDRQRFMEVRARYNRLRAELGYNN